MRLCGGGGLGVWGGNLMEDAERQEEKFQLESIKAINTAYIQHR